MQLKNIIKNVIWKKLIIKIKMKNENSKLLFILYYIISYYIIIILYLKSKNYY